MSNCATPVIYVWCFRYTMYYKCLCYKCITPVFTCIMYYTCIYRMMYTPVLHMWSYPCYTCVGTTQLYYMCITCVLHVFYVYITCVWITFTWVIHQEHNTCNTRVAHLVVYMFRNKHLNSTHLKCQTILMSALGSVFLQKQREIQVSSCVYRL